MIKISKYRFNSQEQAQDKIDALKVEVENDDGELELIALHTHTIVELGFIVLEQGEYDEEGNEVTAPVLSDKYHVDVLWNGLEEDENGEIDHPYGWKSYSVDREITEGQGFHSFAGVDYQSNKF
jgi:hypothetical protein